ncbi:hypothetical protein CAPTEDRAFT_211677 [Capitella teleta]|uniref:Uncharacterized protein n=1 Tax=Capitella teleta TaxID=283909 RepID=R7UW97_CAPTE|nr:hypothetical protein CAPTEDRAFT_211677 [Capitella teleta]|eukprot:ELU07636.1 hypothetical protein CAPTEDRAFT_211677 [Capitella teleta]
MADTPVPRTEKESSSSELSMVTMNLSGRFKGREIRRYGQDVLTYILNNHTVSVFFGQQMNFRPSLPDKYAFEGGTRAFIYYDKTVFRGCDEKQYRHYLKDMENKGRLRRYYLPDSNFVVVKMRGRQNPRNKFLAISWMTDECQGKLKSLNLVRKLLSFAADLCAIEEMPVVVAGTFRITLEEAQNVVYTEFEGFRVYGYMATRPKRMLRMSNFFFTAKPVRMEDVRPLLCSKIDIACPMSERWLNPEDAFYWDPAFAKVRLRRHTATTSTRGKGIEAPSTPQSPMKTRAEWTRMEPTLKKRQGSIASDGWSDFTEMERKLKLEEDEEDAPRSMKNAISAPALDTKLAKTPEPEPGVAKDASNASLPQKNERTLQSVPDLDNPSIFAKLEDTLKRIEDRRTGRSPTPGMSTSTSNLQDAFPKNQEDEEVKHFSSNGFSKDQPDSTRTKTPRGFINPDDYDLSVDLFRKEEKVSGFDTFGLKMELTRQEDLDIQLEDATHLLHSISETNPMRVVEGASQPNLTEPLHNGTCLDDSDEDPSDLSGVLKKIPSYIELYDEELLENNTGVCIARCTAFNTFGLIRPAA